MSPAPKDEQPPATPITIEWAETARYRTSLTAGQYRELLGLGGTPDDVMPSRISMIGMHAPEALESLVQHSDYLGSTSYVLETVDGVQPGEL